VNRGGLAQQPWQPPAAVGVAEEPEVDPGEHDLLVPLTHSAANLVEDRDRGAAPCAAADERDDAERAGERAAVLDLHERPHALESRVVLDATDRADVAGDERGRLLRPPRDDDDVVRETVPGPVEVRAAPGH